MVSFAIPPVIIRVMHHCTHRIPKPFCTTLELYLHRTARCCLSCYSYSPSKSFVYSDSNVWFVATGVEFYIQLTIGKVPYVEAVEGTAGGYSC